MNLSYIVWVAAFNTAFLLAYIVVLDLGIYAPSSSSAYDNPYIEPTPLAVKKHRVSLGPANTPAGGGSMLGEDGQSRDNVDDYRGQSDEEKSGNPPRLLAAINHHGLYVFLLVRFIVLCLPVSCSPAWLLICDRLIM